MMQIDTTTDFGKRVERRLREETIVWLTTVRRNQTPQPSPVWFLWDGETVLIHSQPNTQKIRNITNNSTVSLHFDGDGKGGDIIVITGTAAIMQNGPSVTDVPAYVEKYTEGIKQIGMTPEQMAQEFSTAIRVTPTDLRGH